MDKLIEYPKLIKRILTEYIELCDRPSQPNIETFLITDKQNGHLFSYSSI
ncbi:XisI protein [Microcoleus vaginatus GB1-A2]